MDIMAEYHDALERLIKNSPIRVPRGSKISKDTVALEAGRGRGTIKKSRSQFFDLIDAIERAAAMQNSVSEDKIAMRDEARIYRDLYEAALVREVSLLVELTDVRAELANAKAKAIKAVK